VTVAAEVTAAREAAAASLEADGEGRSGAEADGAADKEAGVLISKGRAGSVLHWFARHAPRSVARAAPRLRAPLLVEQSRAAACRREASALLRRAADRKKDGHACGERVRATIDTRCRAPSLRFDVCALWQTGSTVSVSGNCGVWHWQAVDPCAQQMQSDVVAQRRCTRLLHRSSACMC
jgi:hypothetical protein